VVAGDRIVGTAPPEGETAAVARQAAEAAVPTGGPKAPVQRRGDAKEHKTKSLPHCVFIHGWPEGTTGEAVQEVFPVGSAVRMLNKGKWAAVSLPTAAAAEEFVWANVTEALQRGLRLKINGESAEEAGERKAQLQARSVSIRWSRKATEAEVRDALPAATVVLMHKDKKGAAVYFPTAAVAQEVVVKGASMKLIPQLTRAGGSGAQDEEQTEERASPEGTPEGAANESDPTNPASQSKKKWRASMHFPTFPGLPNASRVTISGDNAWFAPGNAPHTSDAVAHSSINVDDEGESKKRKDAVSGEDRSAEDRADRAPKKAKRAPTERPAASHK